MPIETDDDRAIFLDPEDFGAVVEWPEGSLIFVNGVFDDTAISLSAGDLEFAQTGGSMQVLMRSIDMPISASHGDEIAVGTGLEAGALVGARSYRVLEIQNDGTGMTVVRLEEPEAP